MTTYNDWYVKADQAWTMVEDLESEQASLDLQESADSIRYDEIEYELKEWKEAAEYAEKMMQEEEKEYV